MRSIRRILFLCVVSLALLVGGCADSVTEPGGSAVGADMSSLFDRVWEFRVSENPMFATSVGDLRFNDQLGSVAPDDLARRAERAQEFLDELGALDLDSATPEERVNASILERQLWDEAELYKFGAWQMPLTAETGFHTGFARLGTRVPLQTAQQYEDYVERT